jgi:hypothetical protein
METNYNIQWLQIESGGREHLPDSMNEGTQHIHERMMAPAVLVKDRVPFLSITWLDMWELLGTTQPYALLLNNK